MFFNIIRINFFVQNKLKTINNSNINNLESEKYKKHPQFMKLLRKVY